MKEYVIVILFLLLAFSCSDHPKETYTSPTPKKKCG